MESLKEKIEKVKELPPKERMEELKKLEESLLKEKQTTEGEIKELQRKEIEETTIAQKVASQKKSIETIVENNQKKTSTDQQSIQYVTRIDDQKGLEYSRLKEDSQQLYDKPREGEEKKKKWYE